jgi:predicted helicase
MRHLLGGDNIALAVVRQLSALPWCHVLVCRDIVESAFVSNRSREICHVMPLWLTDEGALPLQGRGSVRSSNLQRPWLTALPGFASLSHRQVLGYIYATLHSPSYRHRYEQSLQKALPRVFVPANSALLRDLTRLGGELLALHLMESPKLHNLITTYTGPKNPEVGRVGWSRNTVWLDAAATKKGQPATPGTIGFRGVPEAVWNFHIGSYQVCEKWLKDRKGRPLSAGDIDHYRKIVLAVAETIRLMAEIDKVIERHGGWPAAFLSS